MGLRVYVAFALGLLFRGLLVVLLALDDGLCAVLIRLCLYFLLFTVWWFSVNLFC